jgi:small subunit ribosomal protein S1
MKINNITDKAIFGELTDTALTGMLHYKEISYEENIDDLKKFKKNDVIDVKVIEIKDDKIRFSKRALDKDPLSWFEDNNKKVGSIITTRIHEVLKTGVKVSLDKEKKLITTIKKSDLAKETANQRVDIFAPGNALDAKLIELDLKTRKINVPIPFSKFFRKPRHSMPKL